MFGVQVHAEIEFELLEGAMLALKTLNGLYVQGQPIKVTLFPFSLCSLRIALKVGLKVLSTDVSSTMFACVCVPFQGPEACL